jgi:hypothetical protein
MATNPLLVLHMDGPPGSTVFTDSSGNGRNITPYVSVGPPTNTSVSSNSYFGNGSLYVGGGNYDGLQVDPSSDFNFGTGPWTIDFWFNLTVGGGNIAFVGLGDQPIGFINSVGVYFGDQPGGHYFLAGLLNPVVGTWYHIAFQRDNSGNVWGYTNGVRSGDGGPSSQSIGSSTKVVAIGNAYNAGTPVTGYIDEVRISNTAIFPIAGFSPPTQPWPLVYSWPTTTKWNVS